MLGVLGPNGAGKSTLFSVVSGFIAADAGNASLDGAALDRLGPAARARAGMIRTFQVPREFHHLTVRENLMAGAYTVNDAGRVRRNLDRMFEMYPILKERARQQAGTLSGGEQQMLAICRGLMAEPKVLLLDEPSLGLAPIIVKGVFDTVRRIRDEGITVVLVEQNANQALAIADYAYVLENGRVALEGEGRALLCDPAVKDAYLGGAQEA